MKKLTVENWNFHFFAFRRFSVTCDFRFLFLFLSWSYTTLWWGLKLTLLVGQLGRRRLFFRGKRHFRKKLRFLRHAFNTKIGFSYKNITFEPQNHSNELALEKSVLTDFFRPKLIAFWSSYDRFLIFLYKIWLLTDIFSARATCDLSMDCMDCMGWTAWTSMYGF